MDDQLALGIAERPFPENQCRVAYELPRGRNLKLSDLHTRPLHNYRREIFPGVLLNLHSDAIS